MADLLPARLEIASLRDLPGVVGGDLVLTEYLDLTQERINLFAEATEDRQWIHIDPEAAASSVFGGTIAHGFLTLSLMSPLLTNSIRICGVRMGVNLGVDYARFPTAVPSGSKIRARIRLVAVAPRTRGGVDVTWNMTIECAGKSLPVGVAEWKIRYFEEEP
jgi:acyl dehydratase